MNDGGQEKAKQPTQGCKEALMKEVELNLSTPSQTLFLSGRHIRRVMEWVKSRELLQPS